MCNVQCGGVSGVLGVSHQTLPDAVKSLATPKASLQEAKPGQYNGNETIPTAVFPIGMWIYDTQLIVFLAQKSHEFVKKLKG